MTMILNTFPLTLIAVLAFIIFSLSLFYANLLPNNINNRNALVSNTHDTKISDSKNINQKNLKIFEDAFNMLKTRKGHSHKRIHKKRKGKFQVSFEGISSLPQYETICKAEDINVKVSFKNCISQELISKYCHGTCSSIFIPQMRPHKMKASFQSVSSCVPDDHQIIKIRLECPNQVPDHVYRKIVKINSCSCKQFFP
uniref:DAN domain-containing protein n=1 Tax=Strongyloides venezuelensis TaxID=75913 RepID=A0A0K0FND7_STRVS